MILYNIRVKHIQDLPRVPDTPSPANRAAKAAHADGWAIGLSGLCLLHCLALPVVALAAPAALGLERYHQEAHATFLVVAVTLTLLAFAPGKLHGQALRRSKRAMALAGIGLAFLLSALIGPLNHSETLLTTIGVLTLAAAHALNWWLRARSQGAARRCVGISG